MCAKSLEVRWLGLDPLPASYTGLRTSIERFGVTRFFCSRVIETPCLHPSPVWAYIPHCDAWHSSKAYFNMLTTGTIVPVVSDFVPEVCQICPTFCPIISSQSALLLVILASSSILTCHSQIKLTPCLSLVIFISETSVVFVISFLFLQLQRLPIHSSPANLIIK